MKKKIVVICICLLMIATGVLPIVSSEIKTVYSGIETKGSSECLMNGGWYEVKNNITVLHVNGSYYQMGYQHGFLMKERILQCYRAFLSWFDSNNFSYERLLTIWNSTFHKIPVCYIDEMHGIADGANISFEDVAVANIESLVLNYVTTGVAGGNTSTPDSCTSVVAWGPATRDGRLYHFRSCDFDSTVKDPETGISAIDTGVLIVRTPADAYASVSPEWPGWVCTGNGINEHEISIGETTCTTTEFTFNGIGYWFRIRMALDTADTAEDAIHILDSNKTEGCTIIFSDGNIPTAYVLEQTANQSYVGTWDNGIESKWPFWEIDHVIRRTNTYISPGCAKTQGIILSPRFSTLLYILTIILGNTGIGQSFDWLRYKATSKGMMNEWGNLDLNTTMQQMRDVYNFKNNFLWGVIGKKWDYRYPAGVGWQWVACPETGDFLISMSHNNTSAYQMPTTLFNINDLIHATPP